MRQIYDPIRHKMVKHTPEEGVRQSVISALTGRCGYPATHLVVEYAFRFNKLSCRADVVVFNRDLQPALLVECKAPGVRLSEETISQVVRYNLVLQVPYILITNGDLFYLCRRSCDGSYEPCGKMPSFEELCQI